MIDERYADLFALGAQVSLEVAERDIVLTYVLKIFDEAGLLETLVFKGGTCLRKCIYGKETRFSGDLDFTDVSGRDADDVILAAVSALGKPSYGLTFEVKPEDFYISQDKLSCGATIKYQHAWNEGLFKLEISLREMPSLPLANLPLKPQPYFKYLEFKSFTVSSFQFEELLAEKLRAASQRVRSRDLYDVAKAAGKPLNARRVRTLAVIKCWNARDAFDPARFFQRLRSGKYDWDDLRQLVRKSEKIDPERIISTCENRYQFLRSLSEGEKRLMADAKRHQFEGLPRRLLKEI
ncbi:MAG: nucleotidyl transferase AbiEii/AbiGii toxin family protein [Elusimicrobia bacterium]|nr:nucleotidyl transferase AbiEii/AbiGii toxin family protein [Candidatus Obscuribacterium magneticum]